MKPWKRIETRVNEDAWSFIKGLQKEWNLQHLSAVMCVILGQYKRLREAHKVWIEDEDGNRTRVMI